MDQAKNFTFNELVDLGQLRKLLISFYNLTNIVSAIIDLQGNILIGGTETGWQSICVDYHRVNKETCMNCHVSDTALAERLKKGESYITYKCLNGMIDVATPIFIGGEHMANLFTGQFLSQEPDKDFFAAQAKKYDFDLEGYLNALNKVPILSDEKVNKGMAVLVQLAEIIGDMGFKNKKLLIANENLEQKIRSRTKELQEANIKLNLLNHTDALTGISNRRHFDEVIQQMINRSKRYKIPLSLCMIDIDFFKNYNDYYGHQQGDDCLIKVAKQLNEFAQREGELAARYGGEEFVIILLGLAAEDFYAYANSCREVIEKLKIPHEKSTCSPFVTLSMGIVTLDDFIEMRPKELIEKADKALYRAKETGRNRVEIYMEVN